MLKILVNAYAVSPTWGSEPGMGWKWVSYLAKHCELYVITEGEWQKDIEAAVEKHPSKENLHFYYLPVPDRVRQMCWNQGDWRFYVHYRKWQKRVLEKAKEILLEVDIDIIHQLNMIGYREPGLLWKIDGYKYIWGPAGGLETMPIAYLKGAGLKTILFNRLKNAINSLQYKFQPNVRRAVKRSDVLIVATRGNQKKFQGYYHREVLLLNETGCDKVDFKEKRESVSDEFNLLWVGKYDFRKQLSLAIRTIGELKDLNVKLQVAGAGDQEPYKQLARELGVEDKVVFLGVINHDKMNELMQSSDVFLFTSIMDATSTVVMEAIQNQLPVVCFDTCGFGTVVDESIGRKVQLSTPEQSVKDFGRAIRGLYNDRVLLKQLSENCKEQIKLFEWEHKAEQMVEIYKRLITKTKQ